MRQHIGSSSPFSVEYYSKFFDVDTRTVVDRAWRPLNPMTGDYVATVLVGQPDLYGPFWLPYVALGGVLGWCFGTYTWVC
jgi:protein YIPF1/2